MAPPINVQDWYGDRHTCQIASGALARWRLPRLRLRISNCSLLLIYLPRKSYVSFNSYTPACVYYSIVDSYDTYCGFFYRSDVNTRPALQSSDVIGRNF